LHFFKPVAPGDFESASLTASENYILSLKPHEEPVTMFVSIISKLSGALIFI
jgi:hypothetical protein